jgi:hypothetical protein
MMGKCRDYNGDSVLCLSCDFPDRIACCIKRPKTKEDLNEELCKYCRATEYGEDMTAQQVKGTPTGYTCCEGAYCDEAYEKYLDEYLDEEEE